MSYPNEPVKTINAIECICEKCRKENRLLGCYTVPIAQCPKCNGDLIPTSALKKDYVISKRQKNFHLSIFRVLLETSLKNQDAELVDGFLAMIEAIENIKEKKV
jgi:hypothetical protein